MTLKESRGEEVREYADNAAIYETHLARMLGIYNATLGALATRNDVTIIYAYSSRGRVISRQYPVSEFPKIVEGFAKSSIVRSGRHIYEWARHIDTSKDFSIHHPSGTIFTYTYPKK